jgi:hypothetical protein
VTADFSHKLNKFNSQVVPLNAVKAYALVEL